MNTTEFPGFDKWIAILDRTDKGILLVAMMVFATFVWLFNARFVWPRLMPSARLALAGLFYISFLLSVIGVIK